MAMAVTPWLADHAQNLAFWPRLAPRDSKGEIAHAGFQHLARLIPMTPACSRAEARIEAQRDPFRESAAASQAGGGLPKTRIAPSFALSVSSFRISRSNDGLMSRSYASFAAARTTSQHAVARRSRAADDFSRSVVAFHRDLKPLALTPVDGQNPGDPPRSAPARDSRRTAR